MSKYLGELVVVKEDERCRQLLLKMSQAVVAKENL